MFITDRYFDKMNSIFSHKLYFNNLNANDLSYSFLLNLVLQCANGN